MEQKDYIKVYVQWRDSGFSLLADKWQDIDEVKELPNQLGLMETVGFVVDETPEYLVVAQTISNFQDQCRGGYIIWRQSITKLSRLYEFNKGETCDECNN